MLSEYLRRLLRQENCRRLKFKDEFIKYILTSSLSISDKKLILKVNRHRFCSVDNSYHLWTSQSVEELCNPLYVSPYNIMGKHKAQYFCRKPMFMDPRIHKFISFKLCEKTYAYVNKPEVYHTLEGRLHEFEFAENTALISDLMLEVLRINGKC